MRTTVKHIKMRVLPLNINASIKVIGSLAGVQPLVQRYQLSTSEWVPSRKVQPLVFGLDLSWSNPNVSNSFNHGYNDSVCRVSWYEAGMNGESDRQIVGDDIYEVDPGSPDELHVYGNIPKETSRTIYAVVEVLNPSKKSVSAPAGIMEKFQTEGVTISCVSDNTALYSLVPNSPTAYVVNPLNPIHSSKFEYTFRVKMMLGKEQADASDFRFTWQYYNPSSSTWSAVTTSMGYNPWYQNRLTINMKSATVKNLGYDIRLRCVAKTNDGNSIDNCVSDTQEFHCCVLLPPIQSVELLPQSCQELMLKDIKEDTKIKYAVEVVAGGNTLTDAQVNACYTVAWDILVNGSRVTPSPTGITLDTTFGAIGAYAAGTIHMPSVQAVVTEKTEW